MITFAADLRVYYTGEKGNPFSLKEFYDLRVKGKDYRVVLLGPQNLKKIYYKHHSVDVHWCRDTKDWNHGAWLLDCSLLFTSDSELLSKFRLLTRIYYPDCFDEYFERMKR